MISGGSISGTGGRCGTSGCHLPSPGDPGHDAHSRLTHKVQGETVTESLSSSAAERKAERVLKAPPIYNALGVLLQFKASE